MISGVCWAIFDTKQKKQNFLSTSLSLSLPKLYPLPKQPQLMIFYWSICYIFPPIGKGWHFFSSFFCTVLRKCFFPVSSRMKRDDSIQQTL